MTSNAADNDAGPSSGRASWRVLVLVLGGVAINKLSDLVHASAPVILIGSVLALLAVLVYEARHDRGLHPSGRGIDTDADLAIFSLTNLILGAIVGALAVLPVFDEHAWRLNIDLGGDAVPTVFNYELLAVLTIAVLAVVPAWRRKPPLQLAAFAVPALSGMTLALVTLKPSNDFLSTFATWSIAIGLLVSLVYLRSAVSGLYRGFFSYQPVIEPQTCREGSPDLAEDPTDTQRLSNDQQAATDG